VEGFGAIRRHKLNNSMAHILFLRVTEKRQFGLVDPRNYTVM